MIELWLGLGFENKKYGKGLYNFYARLTLGTQHTAVLMGTEKF